MIYSKQTKFQWVIYIIISICTGPVVSENKTADTCINCHKIVNPKIVEEYKNSVHGQIDLSCTVCHGGNNKEEEEEKAHAPTNFKGKFAKKNIPELCNSCHGDINMMKTYRLNANVYNEYLTSKHGKLLIEQNDEKVAVCTDCHHIHNILSKKNPASPAYKLNIPYTCGRCHSDKEYMKQYNIPTNQVEDYVGGIHGQILYGKIEGKNPLLVPVCIDCHSAHGAVPPEVTNVPFMCGTCHFEVLQYFKLSPHFESLKRDGIPKCIDCHGNHKNTLPPVDLLFSTEKESCSFCHNLDKEKNISNTAQTLQKMISNTQEYIKQMNDLLKDYPFQNYAEIIATVKVNVEKIQRSLSHLQKISHSLDMNLIEKEYNNILTIVKSTNIFREKILSKERKWSRGFVLLLISIILLILFIVSIFIAKFILKRWKIAK